MALQEEKEKTDLHGFVLDAIQSGYQDPDIIKSISDSLSDFLPQEEIDKEKTLGKNELQIAQENFEAIAPESYRKDARSKGQSFEENVPYAGERIKYQREQKEAQENYKKNATSLSNNFTALFSVSSPEFTKQAKDALKDEVNLDIDEIEKGNVVVPEMGAGEKALGALTVLGTATGIVTAPFLTAGFFIGGSLANKDRKFVGYGIDNPQFPGQMDKQFFTPNFEEAVWMSSYLHGMGQEQRELLPPIDFGKAPTLGVSFKPEEGVRLDPLSKLPTISRVYRQKSGGEVIKDFETGIGTLGLEADTLGSRLAKTEKFRGTVVPFIVDLGFGAALAATPRAGRFAIGKINSAVGKAIPEFKMNLGETHAAIPADTMVPDAFIMLDEKALELTDVLQPQRAEAVKPFYGGLAGEPNAPASTAPIKTVSPISPESQASMSKELAQSRPVEFPGPASKAKIPTPKAPPQVPEPVFADLADYFVRSAKKAESKINAEAPQAEIQPAKSLPELFLQQSLAEELTKKVQYEGPPKIDGLTPDTVDGGPKTKGTVRDLGVFPQEIGSAYNALKTKGPAGDGIKQVMLSVWNLKRKFNQWQDWTRSQWKVLPKEWRANEGAQFVDLVEDITRIGSIDQVALNDAIASGKYPKITPEVIDAAMNHSKRMEAYRQALIAEKRARGEAVPDTWGITDKGYFHHMYSDGWKILDSNNKIVQFAGNVDEARSIVDAHSGTSGQPKTGYTIEPRLQNADYFAQFSVGKQRDLVIAMLKDVQASPQQITKVLRRMNLDQPPGQAALKTRAADLPGYEKNYRLVNNIYGRSIERYLEMSRVKGDILQHIQDAQAAGYTAAAARLQYSLDRLRGTPNALSRAFDNDMKAASGGRVSPGALDRWAAGATGGFSFLYLKTPKWAIANLMQPWQTYLPFTEFKSLAKSYYEIFFDPQAKAAIAKYGPLEVGGKFAAGEGPVARAIRNKGIPGTTEELNQAVVFWDSYKRSKALGLADDAAANRAIIRGNFYTQFLPDIAIDPIATTKGPLRKVAFLYRNFQIKDVELGFDLIRGRELPPVGKYFATRYLLANSKYLGAKVALGGAKAYVGYGTYKWLKEQMGEPAADMIAYGLPHFVGLDYSTSFDSFTLPYGGDIYEKAGHLVLGPIGGLLSDAVIASVTDSKGALPTTAPERIANMAKERVPLVRELYSMMMWLNGQKESGEYYELNKPDGSLKYLADGKQVFWRSLGFKTTEESKAEWAANWWQTNVTRNVDSIRGEAAARYIQALTSGDPESFQMATKVIEDWNEINPQLMISPGEALTLGLRRLGKENDTALRKIYDQVPAKHRPAFIEAIQGNPTLERQIQKR